MWVDLERGLAVHVFDGSTSLEWDALGRRRLGGIQALARRGNVRYSR